MLWNIYNAIVMRFSSNEKPFYKKKKRNGTKRKIKKRRNIAFYYYSFCYFFYWSRASGIVISRLHHSHSMRGTSIALGIKMQNDIRTFRVPMPNLFRKMNGRTKEVMCVKCVCKTWQKCEFCISHSVFCPFYLDNTKWSLKLVLM